MSPKGTKQGTRSTKRTRSAAQIESAIESGIVSALAPKQRAVRTYDLPRDLRDSQQDLLDMQESARKIALAEAEAKLHAASAAGIVARSATPEGTPLPYTGKLSGKVQLSRVRAMRVRKWGSTPEMRGIAARFAESHGGTACANPASAEVFDIVCSDPARNQQGTILRVPCVSCGWYFTSPALYPAEARYGTHCTCPRCKVVLSF